MPDDVEAALTIARDLLARVPDPITQTAQEDGVVDPAGVLLHGLYVRAADVLGSIDLLVTKGCFADAASLARSLFEIGLIAEYVSLDPEKRARDYATHGLVRQHRYYRGLKELRPDHAFSRHLELQPHFENARRVWEDREARTAWPSGLWDMAVEVDRELVAAGEFAEGADLYRWTYRLVYHDWCDTVHTGPRLLDRTLAVASTPSEVNISWRSPTGDDAFRRQVFAAVPMFIRIVKLATDRLGVDLGSAVTDANDRFVRLAED